jgi:hypothetical protein
MKDINKLNKICVSYCLYGDYHKYSEGLLSSLPILKKNNFSVFIAVSREVPFSFIKSLEDGGCTIRQYDRISDSDGMFERIDLHKHIDEFEVIFVRDTDSVIQDHEINFMHRFIDSDYLLHVIRSHPLHDMPVMGGLFGYKTDVAKYLNKPTIRIIFNYLKNHSRYGRDQTFLLFLYARFQKFLLVHSSGNFIKGEKIIKDNISTHNNYCGKPTMSKNCQYKSKPKNIGNKNIMSKIALIKLYNLLFVSK